MSGGTQISDISLDQPGGENANSVPKTWVYMKSFVLFLILALVEQRVYVSLFFPINTIILLGKPPLWGNFISQGKKPCEGETQIFNT